MSKHDDDVLSILAYPEFVLSTVFCLFVFLSVTLEEQNGNIMT